MPRTTVASGAKGHSALKNHLVGNRILMLALLELQEIGRQIVIVHRHVVLEILVAGGRTEGDTAPPLGKYQAGVEHVTAVVALAVSRGQGRLVSLRVPHPVGEGVLAGVLIVEDIVELEGGGGQAH